MIRIFLKIEGISKTELFIQDYYCYGKKNCLGKTIKGWGLGIELFYGRMRYAPTLSEPLIKLIYMITLR